jgi:MFS family permease
VVFNTWGSVQTFGAWQSYYSTHLPESASSISWVSFCFESQVKLTEKIGSIQLCLLFFLGPIAGRALDGGYFRITFAAGLALQLVGIFCTSAATKYWQLLLSQGFCEGIGMGLQFAPSIALISTYFSRKRAIAFAMASSGSSTGGLVYPLIVRALLPKIGFGWTVRVIGFITLFVGALAGCFLRTHIRPRKAGPLIELRAFKELPYLLFCVGMFLVFWGLFFPFYYIPSYATNVAHASASSATIMLLCANVAGIPSRLAMNLTADRHLGPLTLIIGATGAVSLVDYLWILLNGTSKPTAGTWVFAVAYGFVAATVMGLFPAALSGLTTDLSKQGARMGMGFAVAGVACLTGPALGGALVQAKHGSYLAAQIWAGTSVFVGMLVLAASRYVRVGWSFERKI